MKLKELLEVMNTWVCIYKGNQTVTEGMDALHLLIPDSPIKDFYDDQVDEITQKINTVDDGCILIYLKEGRK